MKRAILNVAVQGGGHGQSWYATAQTRLGDSLDSFGESADQLFWTNEYPSECPPHQEVPYAMKPFAFREARERGYNQALWFDSSCVLVKPLDEAWDILTSQGYLLGEEGWTVGQWCIESVREIFGRTQEELDTITLVEGKMIGLDFDSVTGNLFLDAWTDDARRGVFNGPPDTHRHDIVSAGVLAADMNMTLTPHLIEIGDHNPPHPEVYVQASGM